ncbi:MAG: Unknown protein [uncultured Aureispira sp.]|uniref:Leucine-rich repeat domain-containing protein n=1 Tax=uncultured Aureispira sp. TaxID=1331704 RepID=A0A6S6UB81_9BACT|nr:MAG: Unknown protein [uncultured Aureispira sp.]
MTFKKEELDNLSSLLSSSNSADIQVAFQILEGTEDTTVLEYFASDFFAMYVIAKELGAPQYKQKHHSVWENRHTVEAFLDRINIPEINAGMKSRRNIVGSSKMKSNLVKLCKGNILDANKIALFIFKKCGLGLNYLVSELDDNELRPILADLKNGKKLILANRDLTKVPKVIFEFTDLELLSLSSNKIASIPKEIQKLVHLKYLFLDANPIKKIAPEISKLKELEYIDLRGVHVHLKAGEVTRMKKLEPVLIGWAGSYKGPIDYPEE